MMHSICIYRTCSPLCYNYTRGLSPQRKCAQHDGGRLIRDVLEVALKVSKETHLADHMLALRVSESFLLHALLETSTTVTTRH